MTLDDRIGSEASQKRGRPWPAPADLLVISAVVFALWALTAIALIIYVDGARDPTTHELRIPAAASQLIAEGKNPLELPASWSLYADDVLVLVNEDSVVHRLGRWVVPPGETLSIELQPAWGGFFACSLHPNGEITLDVQPRRFDWMLTLWPALILGVPLGIGASVGRRGLRHLEDPTEHAGGRMVSPDR